MQLQLGNLIIICIQLSTLSDHANLNVGVQLASVLKHDCKEPHDSPLCTSAATARCNVTQWTCSHSCFALSASGSDKVEKLQVTSDTIIAVCDSR